MKKMIPYAISISIAIVFNLLVLELGKGKVSTPLLILLDIPVCVLVSYLLKKNK